MTETELVLASLTTEELEDAARFMGHMLDRWLAHRAVVEREGHDALLEIGYHGTDGPVEAIHALDLAIIRERAIRGGATPWEASQSTDGHPAKTKLDFYRERLELNPDLGVIPRLGAAGVLEVVCPSCGQAKPLTVAFWEWQGSFRTLACRACRTPTRQERQAVATAVRDAIVDDELAQPSAELVAWSEAVELDEVAL